MFWKDIVHVYTDISFGTVSLDIKLAQFFLLLWNNIIMFKLALVPLWSIKITLQMNFDK